MGKYLKAVKPYFLANVSLILALFLLASPSWAGWFSRIKKSYKESLNTKAQVVSNTPQSYEASYVEIVPYSPYGTSNNNLKGIERDRQKFGVSVLSPDQQRFAVVETKFLPDLSYQTYSQIWIMPVGPLPTKQDYFRAYPYEKPPSWVKRFLWEKYQPVQAFDQINAQAFWSRYQPQSQFKNGQIILKAPAVEQNDFEVGQYNIVDWDTTGTNLLATYMHGIHHLGVYKTIPVVVNTQNGDVKQLRYLPDLVSSRYWEQLPKDQKLKDDIRVLGYSRSQPNIMLLRLVGFKPQETTLAFYGYDLEQGTLTLLTADAMMIQQEIAANGWSVRFLLPRTQRQEPMNVSPQETNQSPEQTPPEPQYIKPKKFWLN